jgi:hypothetical protein
MRSSLTSVSGLRLKVRRVDKSAMSIQPSSNSEKKNLGTRELLNFSSDIKIYHSNIVIKPPLICDYNNSSGSSMHEHFNTRGNKVTKKILKQVTKVL